MKLINADTVVHWQTYDDEHETFPDHEGTIADFLDQMTDEGCPEGVEAVPVRRGRWEIGEDWDGYTYYKCSVCGEEHYLEVGDPVFNNMNYCSNCGADMRKDVDDGKTD